MKYGVVDIGSNSVRLMISDGLSTLSKTVITTQLAEGLAEDGNLHLPAMERTVLAVSFFCDLAKKERVDKIYVFATAAVRQSKNSSEFLSLVKSACQIDVDVVSEEDEAKYGYKGALNGSNGGVVDVGGASTEVIYAENGSIKYSKSIEAGAVKIKDVCGQDKDVADKFIEEKIKYYGVIPSGNYFAIGGTATSIASIIQELDPYQPEKVDGFKVSKKQLKELAERLYKLPISERAKLKGLQEKRAPVIAGGVLLLYKIVEKIGINEVTVSEKDNLEGYLACKLEKI